MTKQEKIKEFYGEDYNKILSSDYGIDENGFSDFYAHGNETFLQAHEIFSGHEPNDIIRVRPLGLGKELELLKNNNGWTKIESEDDLPKQGGDYWILNEAGIQIGVYYLEGSFWEDEFCEYRIPVTHYQPIIKPKPPIY